MKLFKKPADKSAAEVHEETLPKKVELPPRLLYGFGVKAGGRRDDQPRSEVIAGNAGSHYQTQAGEQLLGIARSIRGGS